MRIKLVSTIGIVSLALFYAFSVQAKITRVTERAEAAESEVQSLEFRLDQLEYEHQEELKAIVRRLDDVEAYSHWH